MPCAFSCKRHFPLAIPPSRSHTPIQTARDSAWLISPDSINDKLSEMVTRWRIKSSCTAGTVWERAEMHETAMRRCIAMKWSSLVLNRLDEYRIRILQLYSINVKYSFSWILQCTRTHFLLIRQRYTGSFESISRLLPSISKVTR